MLYSINEIFCSIQGEGRNTGMPAWFIRFAGCNLNCPWCDTDYSEKMKIDEGEIINTIIIDKPPYAVVLTGGEPTLQDLTPLLLELRERGYYIAIETNGTQDLFRYRQLLDWRTVSPKVLPLKVGFILIDELKVIWPSPIFKQCKHIERVQHHYLQPCDDKNKEANTKEAIDIVKQNPAWKLSIQMQKVINVR